MHNLLDLYSILYSNENTELFISDNPYSIELYIDETHSNKRTTKNDISFALPISILYNKLLNKQHSTTKTTIVAILYIERISKILK